MINILSFNLFPFSAGKFEFLNPKSRLPVAHIRFGQSFPAPVIFRPSYDRFVPGGNGERRLSIKRRELQLRVKRRENKKTPDHRPGVF